MRRQPTRPAPISRPRLAAKPESGTSAALLLLGLLVLLPAVTPAAGQDQAAFRVEANFIKVPVTVLDEAGRNVSGLTRNDFALFDDGEPREIVNFILDKAPINVVLLLDTSGSLREELEEIEDAASEFIDIFDRQDQLAVISFADKVEVLQDWTNNKRHLKRAVKKLQRGYRTALYDALLKTAREKLQEREGKRVIILLSDGLDNESYASYEKVLNGLVASDTSLYIVSRTRLIRSKVADSRRVEFLNQVMKNLLDESGDFIEIYFQKKETAMSYLAETTGGRVFFPEELTQLEPVYVQIARELKNQYVLTFLPPVHSENEFREIEVRCFRPATEIFHRELYRAP